MKVRTSLVAQTLCNLRAIASRKAKLRPASIELLPDACTVVQPNQTWRLTLTDSLVFDVDEGRFWSTITVRNLANPHEAPVLVPLVNSKEAKLWRSCAELYQFNLKLRALTGPETNSGTEALSTARTEAAHLYSLPH